MEITMNPWEKQIMQQQNHFKKATEGVGELRFNNKWITPSDIGSQNYCELKVDFAKKLNREVSEQMITGTENHETMVENFQKTKYDQLWGNIYKEKRIWIGEFPIIAPYNDVFIFGKPDQILFVNGKPYILIEFKFSSHNRLFKSYIAQAETYCLELLNLEFDTSLLHYCVVVAPLELNDDKEHLKSLPRLIFEKFLKEDLLLKNESELQFGATTAYLRKFEEKTAEETVDFALKY